MEKIGKLTQEQEASMKPFVDSFVKDMLTYKKIDVPAATEFMQWIYKLSGLKPFKYLCVAASPMGAQIMSHILRNKGDQVRDQVRDQVWAQVRDQAMDQVRDQVWDQVWDQAMDQTRDQGIKFELFGGYVGYSDAGWVSFYKFMSEVVGVEIPDNFTRYASCLSLGIYDTIQFSDCVILVERPVTIKRRNGRMHCEDGPCIEFSDGYRMFMWNGVKVPEKLILCPESITRDDIVAEKNAEVLRCFREKMGADAYYNALTGGNGVVLLDEDLDNQGNMMRLKRTAEPDSILGKHILFLEVVCPSTGRMYNLYPRRDCTNVWDAKASTFKDEKLWARHGDVGIVKIGESPERPVFET